MKRLLIFNSLFLLSVLCYSQDSTTLNIHYINKEGSRYLVSHKIANNSALDFVLYDELNTKTTVYELIPCKCGSDFAKQLGFYAKEYDTVQVSQPFNWKYHKRERGDELWSTSDCVRMAYILSKKK